jgi:DNA polymerase-3 subunit epsilon
MTEGLQRTAYLNTMRGMLDRLPKIFIDIETTHLDPSIGEIIEIHIIKEFTGMTVEYSRKIKPLHIETAHPKALEVNGYKPEDWSKAERLENVAGYICDLLSYGVIIGHNVEFDYRWIKHHLEAVGCDTMKMTYIRFDTISLCREHLPLRSSKMDHVRDFFGWSTENAHTAEKDCRDCRTLFYKLYRANILQRMFWTFKHWMKKGPPKKERS